MLPLVSIIVPVYNMEQYLRKCIDSAVGQTYTNIEIILIDDFSHDNSSYVIQSLQKNDGRIKIIRNQK